MERLGIKKFFRLYPRLFKFALIWMMEYRVSFVVELIVELAYASWSLLLFSVLYSNVKTLVGWSYDQTLFFLGLNIVVSKLFVTLVWVYGIRTLPERVRNGQIDLVLLKPVNSMLLATVGTPYISSAISALVGVYLMAVSVTRLGGVELVNLITGMILAMLGLVSMYFVSVLVISLAFLLEGSSFLTGLSNFVLDYSAYPHGIYNHSIWLKTIFYFILPVIFWVSIPASIVVKEWLWWFVPGSILSTLWLGFLATSLWQRLSRNYTGASS